MAAAANLTKHSFKLLVGTLKIIPMLLAICETLNTALYYLDIYLPVLSFIGGTSFIPLIFIYISSWVYHFCAYHRMFIYYVAILHLINIVDYTIGIPIGYYAMLAFHSMIASVFLFTTLYLYRKEKLCYKHSSNSY